MATTYTLERSGSNVIITYSNGKKKLWQGKNLTISLISQKTGDDFVTLTDGKLTEELDYTLCTSPVAGNLSDFIDVIGELLDDNKHSNYGLIDQGNSSTTPLTADSIFTGTWLDVTNYAQFTCLVTTDVSGTLNMDISSDGVNIDRTKQVTMTTGGVHTLVIVSQYMRVRYTNNSTNQTYFRLQSTFHKLKSKELTSTASQIINDQSDVTLIRVVNDHILDLARNVISDKKSVSIFGRNATIGTTPEDVWLNGGDYNFLLGATTLEVVSNNAEDDYTGLGCRVVLINGLNQNLEETAELVPLVGNGTATTTNSFWRINSAYVAQVGTARGSNYNDINIQSTGSNLLIGQITGEYGTINTADYGIGKTLLGVYTVPAGKTGYIMSMYANIDSNKTADLWLYTVSNVDDVTPPTSGRVLIATIRRAKGAVSKDFTSYIKIEEKSDIWFRAQMDSGTGTFEIEAELFLVDN